MKFIIILLKVCFILIVSFILYIVIIFNIERNPLSIRWSEYDKYFKLFPQGWAFFTRSPREAQVIIYELKNNELQLFVTRHSEPSNCFGLRRDQTFKMIELRSLFYDIPNTWFSNTTWNYQIKKFGKLPDTTYIINHQFAGSLIKGKELVIVIQEIVPWAWLKQLDKLSMPAKIIKVKVK